ncbi:MAG: BACON domain-containing protein [Bacteroidales bacterium]|nr:BACON domain-containing protein [Bacteroidales bacterium]
MKIRGIFAAAIMAVAAFVGCQPVEQLGLPDVTLGATDLEFTQEAGSQEMKFTATREWKAEYDADWIAVTPAGGQGSNDEQSVTVTVTENPKGNRTAKVTVTIGMVSKAFNVNQAGPEGETDGVEALTVKEFIEKADTENYYRLTGTVSGFNATYCSFDITDETGKIYVYSVTDESKAEWTDKIKNGGTVVLQGKYLYYEQKSQHEVVDAIIESFTEGAQSGPEEPVNAIYFNDFDKETSAKVNDKWPYCDEFDGWKNEKGSGVANVTYTFKSASPRATSGNNNIWLPKTGAYLAVQDIALGEATSLELSFNVICGSPGNYKKEFSSSAFKVWLSTDKAKWVELPVSVTANGTEFDDAAASFSVPASTSALSIAFEKIADDVDGYRIDNVNLSSAATAGATVDFTDGVAKDFGSGSVDSGDDNTGNADGKPASLTKVTVAEFIAKEVNETDWYELTGKITEIQKEDYGNFVIEDETESVLIYGMTSKWVGSNDKSFSQIGLKVGDVVTLGTLRSDYQGTPQGGGSNIPAYYISHVAGEGGDDSGNDDGGNTEIDPNAFTIVLDASSKLCDEFPEGSTGVTVTTTYTIGDYEWTFSPSSGNKFSWYTDGYVLWGKKDGYILMPAVEGKKLAKVIILTGKNASVKVQVGVYNADGTSAVEGGEAKTLSEKNAEFSYTLTGTDVNTNYQFRVVSAHNAQFQKLTLVYE